MRAVLYARYSSSNQNERSVADQLALCRDHAAQLGFVVVGEYSDSEISGAHMINRHGVLRLLADAAIAKFDVVVCEALDRLSRSGKDTWDIYERLGHHGVKINTVSRGETDDLHVGLESMINVVFLKELAKKVRRGLKAQVLKGIAAAPVPYGYRKVLKFDADGKSVPGLREIDADEAAIVNRIMREYLAGKGPRAIARDLNADGIAAPRGGKWSQSAICGGRARKTGLLHNEIYIGLLVWNRQRWSKNPDTATRISRLNPPSEWVVVNVPHLRIVDDEIWAAVQAKKTESGPRPVHVNRGPKRLLSGLFACHTCGGSVISVTRTYFGCRQARDTGSCNCRGLAEYDEMEARVLATLKSEMLSPEIAQEYITHYQNLIKQRRAGMRGRRDKASRDLAATQSKIHNLVELAAEGRAPAAVIAKLSALEAEAKTLEAELADHGDDNLIEFHPNLAERYATKIENLQAALRADATTQRQASNVLRSIIDKIVVRLEKGRRPELTLYGDMAKIMGLAGVSRGGPRGDASYGMFGCGSRI